MDVCVCLPCCSFVPKLLDKAILPWNQYDIYNPNNDFSSAPQLKSMDRSPRPSAPVETAPPQTTSKLPKSTMKPHPRYDSSSKAGSHDSKTIPTSKTPSREDDIQALKELEKSGVLNHAEYISKVTQVNLKYHESDFSHQGRV